ncbi:choice-of-anchor L domain-containing protein [Thermococcus sp. 5-4]|uniref:choice-of-anchor L domain-containing protein n=1 Tax=Thermococcus sp. 5-4 TaxID=2008440 RepID=UPI000B49CA2E|nr:choice-of-anchor L domain-containing protein [Thermococcus sp. 5-4]ASA76861.1 hypothetical protein CDI07_00640 [Thermococcus sp. 5-4]
METRNFLWVMALFLVFVVSSPPTGAVYGSVITRDATDEANAILNSNFRNSLVSAEFKGVEEQILVTTKPLLGFPIEGDSYVILSSGDARYVTAGADYDVENVSGIHVEDGQPVTGQDAYDVVRLTLTLRVPRGARVLSFKWRMVSDDYPPYNDYFYAYVELPDGTRKVAATLPNGSIPYITAAVPYFQDVNNQDGVVLDNMTPIYTASVDVSQYGGEEITLVLEVADASDDIEDTAVLIDDVKFDVPQSFFVYNRMMVIAQVWTMYFFKLHDEFDEIYANASAAGVDNDTLSLAKELHENATQMIMEAWDTDNLDDIKLRVWGAIPTYPKMHLVRKAYVTEKDAINVLIEAMKELGGG